MLSPLSLNENLMWKIPFQIVVYDSQIFDFTEGLVNFLEGKMNGIDSVGSVLLFAASCFSAIDFHTKNLALIFGIHLFCRNAPTRILL